MPARVTDEQIEALTQDLGREMFERMRGSMPRFYHYAWWQERLLQLCMQDAWFKVQAFRFIDVLPMMQDDVTLARHLKEYFVLPEHADHGHAHHSPNGHGQPAGHAQAVALRALEPVPATRRLVQLVIEPDDETNSVMDMLLAKKRAADRREWLEAKGNMAEIEV